MSHYLDFKKMDFEAYRDMGRTAREASVLDRLQNNRLWPTLNQTEQDFSINYVERLRRKREFEMDTNEAIELAALFLKGKRIRFAEPVRVATRADALLEVIFMVPEALDPNVVVDPPDIRVLVDPASKSVSLVPQM